MAMRRRQNICGKILGGWMLLATALLHHSCESVLFIELEESDNLIVVNGALTNDSAVAIQVSRTRHILDNAPLIPLEYASVRLYQGGSLVEALSYSTNGYYVSGGFTPSIGETYTLEVENAGYPAVTASSSIPEPVPIRKVDTASVVLEPPDEFYYYSTEVLQFDLTISDPPGEDNYYLLCAEADRSWTEWRDTTVTVVDSLYYGGQWNYFPKDSTYTIFDIHRYTDFPSITTEDLIVEAITSHGVLFSDQVIDGKTYSVRGGIYKDQLTSADSAVLDIRLQSISESYYKYLKSRQKHYDTKENYLAVPVIVYSNVEEGAGFFGGYSTDHYKITAYIPEYWREYWYDYYK
jgi:hypothetical protein